MCVEGMCIGVMGVGGWVSWWVGGWVGGCYVFANIHFLRPLSLRTVTCVIYIHHQIKLQLLACAQALSTMIDRRRRYVNEFRAQCSTLVNGCVFSTPVAGVTLTGLRCPVATKCHCHNGQFVGEKSAPRDLGDSQSLFLSGHGDNSDVTVE